MEEAKAVRKAFHDLKKARRHRFAAAGGALECPTTQGVYLITDPQGRVAHVGRTTRAQAGLQQRLRSHLAGRSSFVILFLNGHRERLRRGYSYQWVEVPDARLRALVEAYATGVLCPRHIGTGGT